MLEVVVFTISPTISRFFSCGFID